MLQKALSLSGFQNAVLALAGFALAFSAWSVAQAVGTEISMCVKTSGASYIIGSGFANQACKTNEQLITFNVQGLMGPQGPAGTGSLVLKDMNGVEVGNILVYPSQVYIPSIDAILDISTNGPQVTATLQASDFLYALPDCQGVAYIHPTSPEYNLESQRVFKGIPSSPGYFKIGATTPSEITYQSVGNMTTCTNITPVNVPPSIGKNLIPVTLPHYPESLVGPLVVSNQ